MEAWQAHRGSTLSLYSDPNTSRSEKEGSDASILLFSMSALHSGWL